jgi:hypothetical protein
VAAEGLFVDLGRGRARSTRMFDALAHARTHPEWWKPVHLSAEADGPPEVGRVAAQRFKGRLPCTLRTTSGIVALDRSVRVKAKVDGDLAGRGV